jgi:propionyl-CoA carboxylase alpha chain
MRDALNAFVIRGISSNIPFQAALMQHPRFHSGIFDTGFIAKEYPKGFDASMVPHDDPALLVSVAAYVYRAFTDRSASISGQLPGPRAQGRRPLDGVRLNKDGQRAPPGDRPPIPAATTSNTRASTYDILSDWKLGESLFNGTCNGEEFTLQVERHKTCVQPVPLGHAADFMVMSARAAELLALMPEKLPPDLSKFLLSPMPGLLREVAVRGRPGSEGRREAGGHRSDEDGKHPQGRAGLQGQEDRRQAAGASLSVDQVIIEFERRRKCYPCSSSSLATPFLTSPPAGEASKPGSPQRWAMHRCGSSIPVLMHMACPIPVRSPPPSSPAPAPW